MLKHHPKLIYISPSSTVLDVEFEGGVCETSKFSNKVTVDPTENVDHDLEF